MAHFYLLFLVLLNLSANAQDASDRLVEALAPAKDPTPVATEKAPVEENTKVKRSLKNPKRVITDDKYRQETVSKMKAEDGKTPAAINSTVVKEKKVKRSLKNPKREIRDDKYNQELVEKLKKNQPEAEKEKKLFDWEFLYKYQVLRNTHGGVEVGTNELSYMDLKSEVNLDRYEWGKGLKGFINGVGIYGSSLQQKVGDIQYSTNIDAPTMFILYQAWVEKEMFDDLFSILVGVLEVNSEFNLTNSSVLFFNSSFGMGAELANTGFNGPSTYPYTSFGARAKIDFPNKLYAMWGIFDGIPGDPNSLDSNRFRWQSSDGLFMISEVGTTEPIKEGEKAPEVFTKFGVGVWGFTQSYDPIDSESGTTAQGNFGIYSIYDKTTSPRFSYFIRMGYANKEVNKIMFNTAVGFNYRAPFSFREEDIFGVGISDVLLSPGFRTAQERDEGKRMGIRETAFEVTYRISIWKDFAIQPNYQFIVDPSGNKDLADAHIVGVQAEIGM